MRPIPLLPIACLTLGLAGCADAGAYPSLAPRAVEKLAVEEPDATPVEVTRDPALAEKVERLLADARAGQPNFAARLDAARAAAASAGAEGGETWVAAQQALSRLEAAGGPAERAAAALDALLIDAGSAAGAAFRAESEALDAIVAGQRGAIAEVGGRLAG